MRVTLEERLQTLIHQGVEIVDPRQTFVASDVRLERICGGAILHPGTRLHGARTFLGPGAEIGREGPAVLHDAVFGPRAAVASGYVEGAVLLERAKLGANAHVRPGTLLEEEASTAHAVGLKHSILLAFATLGSLINFCDVLLAGGTSRKDHSEVGSGFIHFNFTPWGTSGDKATPSLLGDVSRGVFLRQPRIFMGGSSGLVGPGHVGYGAVTAAGQIVRKTVPEGRLVGMPSRAVDVPVPSQELGRAQEKIERNVAYIGELVALRAWYRQVRRPRALQAPDAAVVQLVVDEAIATLNLCIEERVHRLTAYLEERGLPMPQLDLEVALACPPSLASGGQGSGPYLDHVAWVRALDDRAVVEGEAWLRAVAMAAAKRTPAAANP